MYQSFIGWAIDLDKQVDAQMKLRSGLTLKGPEKTYDDFIRECFKPTPQFRRIQYLFDKSFLTIEPGHNPVLLAAYGRIKVLKCLLDLGFSTERVDCKGSTPLMISVICGWDDCTKLLIERGANVYAVNNMGFNVRQIESRYSPFTIIKDTIVRRRWNIIRASMKFLSLHSRAVVTANSPERCMSRGEFEKVD